MIGLMIITHGNLALELKSAMEHMIGDQNDIEILSITPEDDIDIQKIISKKNLKS